MCNTPKYAKLEERTGEICTWMLLLCLCSPLCIDSLHFIIARQDMVEALMKGKMLNTSKGKNLMVNMMK